MSAECFVISEHVQRSISIPYTGDLSIIGVKLSPQATCVADKTQLMSGHVPVFDYCWLGTEVGCPTLTFTSDLFD